MTMMQCRECSQQVSSMAPTCPHCGVPDPSGQDIRRGDCLGCGREIAISSAEACPHCGVADPLTPYRLSTPSDIEEQDASREKGLALFGAALLFVGVFLPMFSAPFVGSQTYFQNGQGDGVIVLILALVAAGQVAGDKTRYVWIPGGLAVLVIGFTFFSLISQMSQLREEMRRELAGNPFAGLGEVAMQSMQMQWGWAVLILGAVFVIAAGMMASSKAGT